MKYTERITAALRVLKCDGKRRNNKLGKLRKRLDDNKWLLHSLVKSKIKRVSAAIKTMIQQRRSAAHIAKVFLQAARQSKQYGRTGYQIGMLAWRCGGEKLVRAINREGVCPRNPFLKSGRGTPLNPGQLCTSDSVKTAIGESYENAPWDLMVDEVSLNKKIT